jgi:hypothetical protein
MKIKFIGLLVALIGFAFSGCSSKEDVEAKACKKLEVGCTKSDKHWPLKIEINKKTKGYIEQKSPELEQKLKAINLKLAKFQKKTFEVDVINFQSVEQLKKPANLLNQKIDKFENLDIYSAGEYLINTSTGYIALIGLDSKSQFQIRKESKAFTRYQDIVSICKQALVVNCKIAFKGKLDGVWSKKDDFPRDLSGWIDLHEIVVLNLELEKIKSNLLEYVVKDAMELIFKSNGNISWEDIEKIVELRIASIN